MMRIYMTRLLLLFLLLNISNVFANDKKVNRAIIIAENYYEDGETKKALAKVTGIYKYLIDLEEREPLQEAKVLLKKAKYENVLSYFPEFSASVKEALALQKKYKQQPLTQAKGWLAAAELYLMYSDIHKADRYLKKAEAVISKVDRNFISEEIWDTYFDDKRLTVKVEILIRKGYYEKAKKYIPYLRIAREVPIDNHVYLYDEGIEKTNQVRLGKREKIRKLRAFADTYTLEGRIERLSGDYDEAMVKLAMAEDWILKKMHRNDAAYVLNKHEESMTLLQRGADLRDGYKMIQRNLFTAERIFGAVHREYLRIHEDLITEYIKYNHYHASEFPRWEFDQIATRYFADSTVWRAKAKRMEALVDYHHQHYDLAQETLMELYMDSLAVPVNHVERLEVLRQLYDLRLAEERYTEAHFYLNEWIDLTALIYGKVSLPYKLAKTEEAAYYTRFTNQLDLADSLFTKYMDNGVRKILRPTHFVNRELLQERAAYYQMTGQYDSVAVLSDEILLAYETVFGKEHTAYANGLAELVKSQIQQGNYKEAYKNVEVMLTTASEYKNPKGAYNQAVVNALQVAAQYYLLIGVYNEARKFLSNAQGLIISMPYKAGGVAVHDNIVEIYLETERFEDTQKMLAKSIEFRAEVYGETSRFLLTPYNQTARLHYLTGEYVKADSCINVAYNICKENFGEKSIQMVETLEVMTDIKMAMGDFVASKALIREYLNIIEEVHGDRNHLDVAQGYTRLALAGLKAGAGIEEVKPLLETSVEIIKTSLGDNNPAYASALKNLAVVEIEENNLEKASQFLLEAKGIWEEKMKKSKNTYEAEIYMLLGDVELRQSDFKQAINHYKRSRKIYSKVFDKEHPMYVRSLAKLGQAYYTMGKLNKSVKRTEEVLDNYFNYIEKFFPALSAAEKGKYWQIIRHDFEFYTNLALETENKKLVAKAYKNSLLTKSLLLNSSIKIRNSILNSGDSLLIEDYNKWIDDKERLTKVLAIPEHQREAQGIDVKELEKDIVTLEKALSARSQLFGDGMKQEKMDWKAVQAKLKPREAAVEIVRYRYFDKAFTDSVVYAAYIVTPETKSTPKVVKLKDGALLDTEGLGYYRVCIEFELEDEESYKRFWKPIEDELLGQYDKVYFAGDGVYSQINLESIPTDQQGDFILDHANLALITSSADLLEKQNATTASVQKQTDPMALFGNPIYYKDLPKEEYDQFTARAITQLPGTLKEVKGINTLLSSESESFRTEVYIHKAASEERIKELKSPFVLHIATHGYFKEDESDNTSLMFDKQPSNPLLRSGLLLTNGGDLLASNSVYQLNKEEGVLTAYEVMNCSFDNTELAVLSACETGLGDNKVGEGVYGLQRAFLVAGAKAIIMSLFEVSDAATQQLMKYFYENWIHKKMDKREAFVSAKKQLRKEFPAPKYWGAFVMVGE